MKGEGGTDHATQAHEDCRVCSVLCPLLKTSPELLCFALFFSLPLKAGMTCASISCENNLSLWPPLTGEKTVCEAKTALEGGP